MALHWPASVDITLAAGAEIVGSSASFTVTTCVAEAVLPEASVAVQVTVVAPLTNVAGASLVTVTPAQLSPAVAVPRATAVAVHWPASVLVMKAAGAAMVGFTLSFTVTVKVCASDPQALVAVAVTVVVPTANT